MKIGMLIWESFGTKDMIEAFIELGHSVEQCPFSNESNEDSPEKVEILEKQIQTLSPDVLFSFNYFPSAAIVCKDLGIPYVSWVYDSPYVKMYHYTIAYPTNYVFVFDSATYMEFHKEGISTVYYLPMAANPARLASMQDFEMFKKTDWNPSHTVAFVGSLYTEKHRFYERLSGISDYTRGYIEGLMEAQKKVYGYNFIQELLPQDILTDMKKSLPMKVSSSGVETIEYLFAQYVINRQITVMERRELLTEAAAKYGLDLYTPDKTVQMSGCTNHGALDAYDYAPYVYKSSAVNLNITLRSIINGIPLRAFEIMGAGGFLLTNYQADFMNFFTPDEDFVFFESKSDMLDKLDYYLKHEEERRQIAKNGFHKVAAQHTFIHRAEEIISCLRL